MMSGQVVESRSATAQWVVTRRPASRPACASRKAPLQTDPWRRAWLAAWRSQAISAALRTMSGAWGAPATSSVSDRKESGSSMTASGNSLAPDELTIGPGRRPITRGR